MTHYFDPKWTPVTYQDLVNATLLAWNDGTDPLIAARPQVSRAPVRLVVCQFAIESGLKACQNFAISGIKTRPNQASYNWQFFKTTEFYWPAQLKDAQLKGPGLVQVLGLQPDGRTKIYLLPKHDYCCFRAYETLADAVQDHLLTLQRRFPHGWAGLLTGDDGQFAAGLHQDGYFTAPQKAYQNGLAWRWTEEMRAVSDTALVWGDVQ